MRNSNSVLIVCVTLAILLLSGEPNLMGAIISHINASAGCKP